MLIREIMKVENFIYIPVDKGIEAITELIEVIGKMPKKRQDKIIRLMFFPTLFIIMIFAAYGYFMRGHSLW